MLDEILSIMKAAFMSGFEEGKNLGRRRGSLDPRVGLGLAATFITAFIALMVIAQILPTTDSAIPSNSTLYTSYTSFKDYVGKAFNMWGLAIFISVLGLVIGAIWAFMRD